MNICYIRCIGARWRSCIWIMINMNMVENIKLISRHKTQRERETEDKNSSLHSTMFGWLAGSASPINRDILHRSLRHGHGISSQFHICLFHPNCTHYTLSYLTPVLCVSIFCEFKGSHFLKTCFVIFFETIQQVRCSHIYNVTRQILGADLLEFSIFLVKLTQQ